MNLRTFRFLLVFGVLFVLACGLFSPARPIATATIPPASTATDIIPITANTATPTSSPPSVLAAMAVPCLTGPGEGYELVVNLQAGEKAEITGRFGGFWVVKTSDGSECWVAEENVSAEGDVSMVAGVDPPATPEPVAPAAPTGLQVVAARCSVDRSVRPVEYINEFHLAWTDMSSNEDGFWLYRDGTRVAELAANRTDVIDEIIARNNRSHFYYVIAYNAVGESKSEIISLTCEGAGEGGGGGGGGGPGPGGGP